MTSRQPLALAMRFMRRKVEQIVAKLKGGDLLSCSMARLNASKLPIIKRIKTFG
jgi:hypothetical protein